MDHFWLYWKLFGWFWKLLLRPDFVLCFVIGAELVYQIRHDRRGSRREEERLKQEKENIRKERAFKLLGLWYMQAGGGDSAYWLMSFDERHPTVKNSPSSKGSALFDDWGRLGRMEGSFEKLRPNFAEYLDFEAANKIITHNWASLRTGITQQKLNDWDWCVSMIEKARIEHIVPVTDCFLLLSASLLGTWVPGQYDATKLRADYFATHRTVSDDKPENGQTE
jgi:hypothetical protein